MNPVQVRDGQILFDGKPTYVLSRRSDKFLPHLSKGHVKLCERWIDRNLSLNINTLTVPSEETIPNGGQPYYKPHLPINQMLNGVRVKENQIDRETLAKMYSLSEATGVAFILLIDATLLHHAGLAAAVNDKGEKIGAGMIGHYVSRTLDVCRQLAEKYPRAKVWFDFHDGWDIGAVKFKDSQGALRQQAKRVRRWIKGQHPNHQTTFSLSSPGPQWKPEQYPEAVITCSESGGHCSYPTSNVIEHPWYQYQIASVHAAGPDMMDLPVRKPYRPLMVSRTARLGVDENHEQYLAMIQKARKQNIHFCICDDTGFWAHPDAPETKLEQWLRGTQPEPPPPEPPPENEWKTIRKGILFGNEIRLQWRSIKPVQNDQKIRID